MIKSKIKYFCLIIGIILCGFLFSSCCSPNTLTIDVNFIGVDSELKNNLVDYKKQVKFNEPAIITFKVPEGFDHTKIDTKIDGVPYAHEVNFDASVVENLQYSVGKTITINIDSVKRDLKLDIDLTNMPKLEFNVELDKNLQAGNFSIVTVDEDSLDNLTNLNDNIITNKINFVSRIASVEYGEYAFLIFKKSSDSEYVETVYSEIGNFTLDAKKTSIGSNVFATYDSSKRGNSYYYINYQNDTRIYYLGPIKEDLKLSSSIPNYVEDKGFDIQKSPNIFYLFTNLSSNNSETFSLQSYVKSDRQYVESDDKLDKIEDFCIEMTDESFVYNNRYDVHRIYIGDDLDSDDLVNDVDKLQLSDSIYFNIQSKIDTQYLNIYLLNYEKEKPSSTNKLELEIISQNGLKYFVINKNVVENFLLERDTVNNGNITNYKIGSAILYIQMDYKHFQEDRQNQDPFDRFKYTRIHLHTEIIGNKTNLDNHYFYFVAYIKNGEKLDYGLIDYHYASYDMIYFMTEDLFEKNPDGTYGDYKQNSLFVELRGFDYESNKSITISSATFYLYDVKASNEIFVENPKEFNGVSNVPITIKNKEHLYEYSITSKIVLNPSLQQFFSLNFSQMEFPNVAYEGIYFTNNNNFSELKDFVFVNNTNKDTIKNINISQNQDLYYFVRCESIDNFDFKICLDPENPTETLISSTIPLKDVIGNNITLEINGAPYNIFVVKMDAIYGTIDGNIYAVKK